MAHLMLALLGPFQAALDGEPIRGLNSDHLRALLAYLAVEGSREHTREALASLLWPERPDREAVSALRHALSNLRFALGERSSPGDSQVPSPSRVPSAWMGANVQGVAVGVRVGGKGVGVKAGVAVTVSGTGVVVSGMGVADGVGSGMSRGVALATCQGALAFASPRLYSTWWIESCIENMNISSREVALSPIMPRKKFAPWAPKPGKAVIERYRITRTTIKMAGTIKQLFQ